MTPKTLAVVGGKHSGKTTVIENLTLELTRRGYKVGVIKEMVRIPTLDTPATETCRYNQAGAKKIVAVPRSETVIFVRERLEIAGVLPYLEELDYVLLEGFESEKTLPKIIAAKTVEEAQSFSDGLAIAVSGLLTEDSKETQKAAALVLPVFNSYTHASELSTLVEQKAFSKLPDLPHCGECGYSNCYELAKAKIADSKGVDCALLNKTDFVLEVNGLKIPLKEFPQQIIQSMVEQMVLSLEGIPQIKTLKIEVKKG
ncbi:MAG: molybdopterin-guanine dinucleotide biosynthesis protein B [Candidatus Bathyarchaeota archaeon]|nr:molybdopterin-guanine dinucleotide biosynthesis protein B [Candidatus Bathyarchaeota archaeon]